MLERHGRSVLLLAAVLAATLCTARGGSAGDWVQFRLQSGNNAVVGGKLAARWTLATNGPISATPTLSGSTLYVGNNRGDLYAVDVRSGAVFWKRHLSNALMSAPIVYRGVVIVGEGDEVSTGSAPGAMYVGIGPSALVGLDAFTGKLRWRTALAGSAMPTPAVIDGVLVHHDGAGWIMGLDPLTGKKLYARNLHSIASMSAALPLGNDRFVTTGVLDNAAFAMTASDGAQVWKTTFPASGSGHGDCPAATDGSRIYCNYVMPGRGQTYTIQGSPAVQHAYALDASTGAKVWDVALESGALPARNEAAIPLVADGRVYFGSAIASRMHALDARTGARDWETTVRGPVKGGVVEVNGTLYFGDFAGYLWAVDANTGAVLGDRKTGSGFNVGSPIVVGQTLLIGSVTGSLEALPLADIASSHDR